MVFENLVVLQLKSFNSKGEEDNPLVTFRKQSNPFAPSTCARHVYVFSKEDKVDTEALHTYLKDHTEVTEILEGMAGYHFLMQWAVGVLSHKLQGNDHFVVGRLRDCWTDYYALNPNKVLNTVMSELFKDVSRIRHLSQSLEATIHSEDLKNLLQSMCFKCMDSRSKGFLPSYDDLLLNESDYIKIAEKNYLKFQIQRLNKSICALNKLSLDDSLLPSESKKPLAEQSKSFVYFSKSLSFSVKKKGIEAVYNIKEQSEDNASQSCLQDSPQSHVELQ